jgi:hypothetical protein
MTSPKIFHTIKIVFRFIRSMRPHRRVWQNVDPDRMARRFSWYAAGRVPPQ